MTHDLITALFFHVHGVRTVFISIVLEARPIRGGARSFSSFLTRRADSGTSNKAKIASRFEEMIKGFIYHRSALSVFLISRYFPRFTRSRACLEGERTRYPFVSRNPVIQSVGSERRLSLPYHGCVMLNREAGNGDDDEEE